jgi:hypothetical protein
VGSTDRIVYVGYAAAAVISFGTLAPWAVTGPVTRSGVDEPFGLYTLLLGAFAVFVLWRWSEFPKGEFLIGLAVVAGVCLATSGFFAFSPQSLLDVPGVDPGYGLIMTLAGSIVLLGVAAMLYRDNPA